VTEIVQLVVVCALLGFLGFALWMFVKAQRENHQAAIEAGTDTRRSYQEFLDFCAQVITSVERDNSAVMGEIVRRYSTPGTGTVKVPDEAWKPYQGDIDEVEAEQERTETIGERNAERAERGRDRQGDWAEGAQGDWAEGADAGPTPDSIIRSWAGMPRDFEKLTGRAFSSDVLGAGNGGHREAGGLPTGATAGGFGVRLGASGPAPARE